MSTAIRKMKRSFKLALGLAAGVGGLAAGAGALAAGATGYAVLRAIRARRHSFRGKTVLITGGSRGLGLALARVFAREGARLAILARDEAELERAAADLRRRGVADVLALPCDVCDEAQLRRAIDETAARFGGIAVLRH